LQRVRGAQAIDGREPRLTSSGEYKKVKSSKDGLAALKKLLKIRGTKEGRTISYISCGPNRE
jgi:hypothetical protein